MRLIKYYLTCGEGFLVRISFNPKRINIIKSKIMAYANAKSTLPIAIDTVVKP